MPVEVQKEVTSTSTGPANDQVSQTATTTRVPTGTEAQDARSDRGNAWIWYVVGIIDMFLLLGVIFKLFDARSVGFANFLYGVTDLLTAPFRGIFSSPTVDGARFDITSVVAIIVYMIVGWILSRLIDLVTRPADSKKV